MNKYLIDTNILIYFINNSLNDNSALILESKFNHSTISLVSYIEMLSWKNSNADELYKIESFLNRFNYHVLNLEISAKASLLRRKYSLKLGDAIIAATAILDNRILLTSDSDFDNITELNTLNII